MSRKERMCERVRNRNKKSKNENMNPVKIIEKSIINICPYLK